ncbi:MAG TPA: hypothetical protein VGL91_03645 [Acidobacteriota bacterium]|jgi:ABC-2 type transport system permease protein
MAVYRQDYRRYEGPLTDPRWRFMVLPRYFLGQVFQSRFFTLFFVICLAVPVGAALGIYFTHNVNALRALHVRVDRLIPIDERFFLGLLSIQSSFGFLMSAIVGPGLISPDLANNALPLYLSRPFSRAEYVLGKMSILVILLSLITWIPALLLFGLQWSLEGNVWMLENLRIAAAILVDSCIWITTVSLLALALSAWVKWRPVAGALLFGVFFAGAGFGEAINNILYTKWGYLINLAALMETIATWLFLGLESPKWIPVWSACLSLLAVCGICLLLLAQRVRACEVVK